MRPCPRLRQIRQLVLWHCRRFDFENRQQEVAISAKRHALLFANYDQAEPRTKPVQIVGFCGCKQPRKIRPVKFDSDKVVGFEIGSQIAWLGANDLLWIDADYIAGAEQPNVARDFIGVVDSQLDGQGDRSSRAVVQSVDSLNTRRGSLPYPGNENMVRRGNWHNHLVTLLNFGFGASAPR